MQIIKPIKQSISLRTWSVIFDYRGSGYGFNTGCEPYRIQRSLNTWKEWFKV